MADNVDITAGSGTTVATDDVGGVQYQRVKVVTGADGTADENIGDTGTAFPVRVASHDTGDSQDVKIKTTQLGEVQATPTVNTLLGRLKTIEDDLEAAQSASIPAGTALIGDVGLGVRTSGGLTTGVHLDVDEAAASVVKSTAGQLYWITATNDTKDDVWLMVFNDTGTAQTPGDTGVAKLYIKLTPNGDTGPAVHTFQWPMGIPFADNIKMFATNTFGDTGTAVAANGCQVNVGYA